MSMFLTVEIPSGGVHEIWKVTNVGHPETGDTPDGDDLRRYEVKRMHDTEALIVDHRRSDGRHVLAAKVFERIAAAKA